MPLTLDPEKLQLVMKHKFQVKICRNCGAKNPIGAEKCRRCRSRNLRLKKFKKK